MKNLFYENYYYNYFYFYGKACLRSQRNVVVDLKGSKNKIRKQ